LASSVGPEKSSNWVQVVNEALLVLRGVHQGNMVVHNVDTEGGGKYNMQGYWS